VSDPTVRKTYNSTNCFDLLAKRFAELSKTRPSDRKGTVLGFLTMDSAVLGLASPVIVDVEGTVLGFEQNSALEVAIGSHGVV
jgi:hypothetical protein